MRALALVLTASVVLVACVAETPGDLIDDSTGGAGASGATTSSSSTSTSTGSGNAGRDYFEANVSPFVQTACASCHDGANVDEYGGPDFLGNGMESYYDTLVANSDMVSASPESSRLITRGVHVGPALTASQYDTALIWLQMEADARYGGSGGFEGPTAEELVAKFASCMTITDWTATGMDTVALQQTLNGTSCHGCHQSGVGANYMTNNNTQASIDLGFDKTSAPPFIFNLITTTAVTGPNGKQHYEVVQSYGWRDKSIAPGSHPKFIFTQQQPKIDAWFDTVINSTCYTTP